MAVAFQQEALRAVQDAVPLYKTLRLANAGDLAVEHIFEKSGYPHCSLRHYMGTRGTGKLRVADRLAMVHTVGLEGLVLVHGRWLGKRRLLG